MGPTGPANGPTGPTGPTGPNTPWQTTINGNNFSLDNAQTVTFNNEFDNGNSGSGTVTINWQTAQKQLLTLTGNCTIAFTAPLGPANFLLRLVQGPGGGFTVTWPAEGLAAGNLAWVGLTKPTLSTPAGANDIMSVYYNGSLYFGSYGINFG